MFLHGVQGEYHQKAAATKDFAKSHRRGSTHRLEGAKYLATVWQMSSGVMVS